MCVCVCGGGGCFSDGGSFIFKWGEKGGCGVPHGWGSVLVGGGGGIQKKLLDGGGGDPPCPPTMGNPDTGDA